MGAIRWDQVHKDPNLNFWRRWSVHDPLMHCKWLRSYHFDSRIDIKGKYMQVLCRNKTCNIRSSTPNQRFRHVELYFDCFWAFLDSYCFLYLCEDVFGGSHDIYWWRLIVRIIIMLHVCEIWALIDAPWCNRFGGYGRLDNASSFFLSLYCSWKMWIMWGILLVKR